MNTYDLKLEYFLISLQKAILRSLMKSEDKPS